tara:strand:- start:28 stop:438 length:411 start_codon:yes stop_codon:yes gene_type:complete
MKKKTNVRTLIRTIVREEVAMAIQEVITEMKKPTQQVSQPKPKKKVFEKKQFSKNSIINEVMNETAASDEWKTMGDGTYDSSKMNDILSSAYEDTSNDNGNLAASMGVNPDTPGMDFLKKDYRAVMKAIDKKQGKV